MYALFCKLQLKSLSHSAGTGSKVTEKMNMRVRVIAAQIYVIQQKRCWSKKMGSGVSHQFHTNQDQSTRELPTKGQIKLLGDMLPVSLLNLPYLK